MVRLMAWILAVLCLSVAVEAFHGGIPLGGSIHGLGRRATASLVSPRMMSASARPVLAKRFVQHKQEALTFYRFLSIVYDTIVNPGHWTTEMRDEALEPAKLGWHDLDTVDVGAGCCPKLHTSTLPRPPPTPHHPKCFSKYSIAATVIFAAHRCPHVSRPRELCDTEW